MKIRMGYVAQNLSLELSTSHTITVTNISKIKSQKEKIERLTTISKLNIANTLKILEWNVKNNIYVYRLSSKIVPLATWDEINFNYKKILKNDFIKLGDFIKKNDIRVSMHPEHFTVINSPNEAVFEASKKELEYHNNMFNLMKLDDKYKLVLHTGGAYGDKEFGKNNFLCNFKKLPLEIQKRIILENDDKIYNTDDVLKICEELKIPMVLDVHHNNVNNESNLTKTKLKRVFNTWYGEDFPPKIHFSSPKSKEEKRAHADYINEKDILKFINFASKLDKDFDIMLEAKAKDLALLKLMENNEIADLIL